MLGATASHSARMRGIFRPVRESRVSSAVAPHACATFAFAQFSSSGLPDPRTKICHLSHQPQLHPSRHNIRLPPCNTRDQHAQMKQLFSAPRVSAADASAQSTALHD